LSGVVFKITRTEADEKRVFVRLFEGKISVRDIVSINNKDCIEKVKKINILENGKFIEGQSISAGDIGVIYGLKGIQIGDVIGLPSSNMKSISIAKPNFRATISAINKEETNKLFKALTLLTEEDPLLELVTDDNEKEIYVNLFGEVQMEILSSILEDSFGLKVKFSNIETIYKETPKNEGNSIIRMWEELNPFCATVGLRIEQGVRGTGLNYVSEVSTGTLPKSFQNAIEEAVLKTSKQGLYGWEVTDIKITLTCGEFFSPMSTPSDFRNVTPMVFMEALYEAKTSLLEPLEEFELRVPCEALSKAIWDLETMRATFDNPMVIEDEFLIKGFIPVEHSKNYRIKLSSYTEGKGMFITKFHGYNIAPLESGKIRQRTTYDPLNRKEYLLHKLNTIRD
jgi:ribosomal protection tetracycline resistance protein